MYEAREKLKLKKKKNRKKRKETKKCTDFLKNRTNNTVIYHRDGINRVAHLR